MRHCLVFALKAIVPSFVLLALVLITASVLNPLLTTGILQLVVPDKAQGQLIKTGSNVSGSYLLLQQVKDEKFFKGRGGYADQAENKDIPLELRVPSASGLDPFLSIEAALYQIPPIAQVRSMSEEDLKKIVLDYTEDPLFGFWKPPLVNMMKLNAALAEEEAHGK